MRSTLDETDGSIAIPHEPDGLKAQSLFAGTSACKLKRSWLVPAVLVVPLGLVHCICSILRMHALLVKTEGFIAIPHEHDWLRPSSLFAGTSACIQKRSWCLWTGGNRQLGLIHWIRSIWHMDTTWLLACNRHQLYCSSSTTNNLPYTSLYKQQHMCRIDTRHTLLFWWWIKAGDKRPERSP